MADLGHWNPESLRKKFSAPNNQKKLNIPKLGLHHKVSQITHASSNIFIRKKKHRNNMFSPISPERCPSLHQAWHQFWPSVISYILLLNTILKYIYIYKNRKVSNFSGAIMINHSKLFNYQWLQWIKIDIPICIG